jgi:neutral ceramidase
MSILKHRRWWKIGAGALSAVIGLVVVLVGPWPLSDGSFAQAPYYRQALQDLEQSRTRHRLSQVPHRLFAGWGRSELKPPPGTPLGGFGGRKSHPSQGTHDTLWAKAVAVSDGEDTAILIGADLLLTTPGIADIVRQGLSRESPLRGDDLFFTASHTHSGPGSLAPGWAAEQYFGPYNPEVLASIGGSVLDAAREAYRDLQPARMALAEVRAGDLIRNRSRQGPVDDEISILLLEQASGRRCVLFSFSAHATVLSDRNLLFSADYPGYSQRFLEQQTGATAVFLGGAVGSMSYRIPMQAMEALAGTGSSPEDPFTRCQALGEEIGRRIIPAIQNPAWISEAEVASVGTAFESPPVQWRLLSPNWRMSNILTRALGVSTRGWMSMVRIGNALFVNVPGDLSGEISADWKQWAAQKGYDLWCSSFSGEYLGYISPDRYYTQWADSKGQLASETGLMSWMGPQQEAYFTSLFQHMFQSLAP